MNKYDITIITKEDTGAEPVKKEIEALSGKILSFKGYGQKKFSYTINKEPAGFYTSIIFEIDPVKLIELNKKLSLKTEILRYLILIYQPASVISAPKKASISLEPESRPEGVGEIEIEKIAEEKIEEKVKEVTTSTQKEQPAKPKVETEEKIEEKKHETEKPKKTVKKEKIEIEPVKEESKATKEIEEEAVSTEERLKALDKKLDELLKE